MISGAVYDATLKSVNESFPQYVRELEGVAHGSGVEFHKVIDDALAIFPSSIFVILL